MNFARTLTVRLRWLIAITCALTLQIGCQENRTAKPRSKHSSSDPAEQNSIAKGLEYLEKMDEYDEKSALAQAGYQFNRWLDAQKLDTSWKPEEFVSRLPRSVREHGVSDQLARRRFDVEDVRYVQECVWMRQISQWVAHQPLDPPFGKWLEGQKARLGEHGSEQLGTAYRLFDWTIRNIQLEALLPSPDEATAAPVAGAGSTSNANAAEPAALRGVPGPGYQFDPIQILMYGRGDAWQRMRIFTLLARQQGVDVVTLAFPGRTIPPRPRPWLSGVLIGDQLYLLDLQLGVPIPSEGSDGIATLSQVLADPTILKSLEIDESHPYRIASEDLAEVVALMDVVGPGLSQRLQLAEKQLVAERRTILYVPISSLAGKIRVCKGISDVYVWSVPFEATWHRLALDAILQKDSQAAARHFIKYSMFTSQSPLARGRIMYLRNQIENREEEPGAKALLIQARVSEMNLKDFETNEELHRQLGISRVSRNEQQWQAQLTMFKGMLTETKQHASFWLGMCQLESGRPDAAVEWLKLRTLEPWPDGLWAPLARYDLARAYEQLGDLAEAQRLLLSDKSLQEHGNYLRARMLEKRLASPTKSAADPKSDDRK